MNRNGCVGLLIGLFVVACNDNDRSDAAGEKDPSEMHPPSQAITDSTKLVDDSVIMPDSTPGNGKQVGKSDSIQKSKH